MILKINKCRHGHMMYYTNDIYVGRSLELYGEYSEAEVELWNEIIKPNMTVIDVGANIGAHTLAFSQIAKSVIAFEPQRQLAQMIVGSLALNEIDNVKVLFGGLSDISATTLFPKPNYVSQGNFGGISISDKTNNYQNIDIVTLDSLSLSPNFIKIDVEGMECKVLWGGAKTIHNHKPIIYIENDRVENSETLIEILMEHDYRLWWHITPLFNPDNFFKNHENVFGNTVSINMLCIHKSVPADINLKEITSAVDVWNKV